MHIQSEGDLSEFPFPGPKFIVGTQGSIDCSQGSTLVTDKKLCKEKVPDAVKKGYHGEGCFEFATIGCFINPDSVWYSTCGTRPTASSHSPVCKLLKGIAGSYFRL